MPRFLIAAVAAFPFFTAVPAYSAEYGLSRALAQAEEILRARAIEAEVDRWKGRLVYEIQLVDEKSALKAYLDVQTGELLGSEELWLKSRWNDVFGSKAARATAGAPTLSELLAELEAETNGKAVEVEFDTEDGQAFYEIEFASEAGETTLYVDAATGERLPAGFDD